MHHDQAVLFKHDHKNTKDNACNESSLIATRKTLSLEATV
jgi:hypothetical protein